MCLLLGRCCWILHESEDEVQEEQLKPTALRMTITNVPMARGVEDISLVDVVVDFPPRTGRGDSGWKSLTLTEVT